MLAGMVGLAAYTMAVVGAEQREELGRRPVERREAEQRTTTPSAASTFKAPRTAWGDPDLQGTWPSGPLMTVGGSADVGAFVDRRISAPA